MKRVLKYTVNPNDEVIEMPLNAKIISAGAQGSDIVIWAEVTEGDTVGLRDVVAMPTGFVTFKESVGYTFIDTVQILAEGLVFHVYELDYNYVAEGNELIG